MLTYDSDEALELVSTIIHIDGGNLEIKSGSHVVQCSRIDLRRISGITVRPFLDNDWNQQLFVLKDSDGEVTDYERENGKMTHGKSFFHFMGKELYHKYHLGDGVWTNLSRQNWAPRPQLSRSERRVRKALAKQSASRTVSTQEELRIQ